MTQRHNPSPANDDLNSLSMPSPGMAPEAPTKEPKTAPPPTKPDTDAPRRDPVAPGRRPDPRENPAPECPPSTCPAP